MSGVGGVDGAAEVGVQNGGLGVSLLLVGGLAGGGHGRIVVQVVHTAIPVEGAPERGGGGHGLVLIVLIELVSLGLDLGQRLVDGGGGDFAVHEHVEVLGGILAIGVGDDHVLHEHIVLVIVVGVGVEPDLLGRNQGGEEVAAVVEDGVGLDSAEVGALGLEELGVDGPEDGVGGHAIEVAAGLSEGVDQLVAIRLDADVFPGGGAIGVVTQTDDQAGHEAQGLGLDISGMLEAGDEVFGGHGVVLFTGVGGPHGVVADDEGPLSGVRIGAPLLGHTGDQGAMRILGQQALDEVGGVVTVGGLVVVHIVQSSDVEVGDHVVGVGTFVGGLCGLLSLGLGLGLFSLGLGLGFRLGLGLGFGLGLGLGLRLGLRLSGRITLAGDDREDHDQSQKQRYQFLHLDFLLF